MSILSLVLGLLGLKGNGIKKIDKVINNFDKLIKQLDKGVALSMNKQSENTSRIDRLTAENDMLDEAIDKATKVRSNLNNLLN